MGDRVDPTGPGQRCGQSQGQLGVIEHAARQHGGVAAGGPPTKGRCRTLNRGCSRGFRLPSMREFASLFQAPSPAVLMTYRKDGTVAASPVWFRFRDDTFEVVIAENDVKLRHLAARPECELLVFEAVPPFRGIRVRSEQPDPDPGRRAAGPARDRCALPRRRAREEVRRRTHQRRRLVAPPGGSREGLGPQGDPPVLTTPVRPPCDRRWGASKTTGRICGVAAQTLWYAVHCPTSNGDSLPDL